MQSFKLSIILLLLTIISMTVQASPNILLIIADDVGIEVLSSFGVGESSAKTPTLDQMADQGMSFKNFWSQPVCSPTRATLITGRYSFRTNIGFAVFPSLNLPENPEVPEWASPAPGSPRVMAGGGYPPNFIPQHGLLEEEYTLPMAFKDSPNLNYSTAAIGKWHLADISNGGVDHPNQAGFDHFSGLMDGGPRHYFSWNKIINGEVSGKTGYVPEDKTNDAIEWILEQGDKPWFMWLAFNQAHAPMHLPPKDNWQSDYSSLDSKVIDVSHRAKYFNAMIESMDTQIGRLIASMEPNVLKNTYIIFLSDNGTARSNVQPPFSSNKAKGTIYQGGVNTPMIIVGPQVESGTVSDALINSTDLFVTIMEMAGINLQTTIPENIIHDSISFMPVLKNVNTKSPRDWIYADYFYDVSSGDTVENYAMRNNRYKLLRNNNKEEFYDLHNDPYEHNNLLITDLEVPDLVSNYESLKKQIIELRNGQ